MKKLFIFFTLFLIAGTVLAGDLSVITGTWLKDNKSTVKLFRVEYGSLVEIASSKLNSGDQFAFAFYPEREAFYVVGHNTGVAINNYVFYIKPGDNLNMAINADNSYKLTGNITPENKEMLRWHTFIAPLEDKSIYYMGKNTTYVDFFPLLEEKLAAFSSFRAQFTGNKEFEAAFEALRQYDMLFLALHYLRVPRTAHPQGEDFPEWYRNISVANFTASERLMDYPYGKQLLKAYIVGFLLYDDQLTVEQKKALRNPAKLYPMLIDSIPVDVTKGEIALFMGDYLKTYDGYLSFKEEYGRYIITNHQKERMYEMMLKLASNDEGQTAVDFKFPDATGKEVALSDFKGKVVYVDVWATWCGPCKEQAPHLKALEEEYADKDVVFMGVSVDNQKDYGKWIKFIEQHGLKGVQLFTGDRKDDIYKPYKVTGIPRFILVGKDGKLISADAPRPSSSEIRVALDAALKK